MCAFCSLLIFFSGGLACRVVYRGIDYETKRSDRNDLLVMTVLVFLGFVMSRYFRMSGNVQNACGWGTVACAVSLFWLSVMTYYAGRDM
jgi:hypothetical protein